MAAQACKQLRGITDTHTNGGGARRQQPPRFVEVGAVVHILEQEVSILGRKCRVARIPVLRAGGRHSSGAGTQVARTTIGGQAEAVLYHTQKQYCTTLRLPSVPSPAQPPAATSTTPPLSCPPEAHHGLERNFQDYIALLQVPAGNHATQAGGAGLAQPKPALHEEAAEVAGNRESGAARA